MSELKDAEELLEAYTDDCPGRPRKPTNAEATAIRIELATLRAEVKRLRELCGRAAEKMDVGVCDGYRETIDELEAAAKGEKR